MSEQCSDCKFWKPLIGLKEGVFEYGLCRVNAPVFNPYKAKTIVEAGMEATGKLRGSFPATEKDDWCGQFQGHEKEKRPAAPAVGGKRPNPIIG